MNRLFILIAFLLSLASCTTASKKISPDSAIEPTKSIRSVEDKFWFPAIYEDGHKVYF